MQGNRIGAMTTQVPRYEGDLGPPWPGKVRSSKGFLGEHFITVSTGGTTGVIGNTRCHPG
jgi:hypothetical protein